MSVSPACWLLLPVADKLFQTLSHFFALYGYWVVLLGVMIENAGLPVPGETVLLFAGFLAFRGQLRIVPVILTAIAGAIIGDSLGYLAGYFGGTALLRPLRGRLISVRKFDRAHEALVRYGFWGVFVARFISGLRVLAGPFAGAFRMPYRRFLAANFSGAVAWAVAIGTIGFLFGRNWPALARFVAKLDWALFAITVAAVVLGVVYRRWSERRRRRW